MVKITYRSHDGAERAIEAPVGVNVMEVAVKNDVVGIEGECLGACSCATCHIYVDPQWTARVGSPDELEIEMLEAVEGQRPNSRLACQIFITDALDGLTVTTPERQTGV